jgi:hypothetical protein
MNRELGQSMMKGRKVLNYDIETVNLRKTTIEPLIKKLKEDPNLDIEL